MKLDKTTMQLFVYKGANESPTKIFSVINCQVELRADGNYGNVKVRCIDGRKFSFGDNIDVCREWCAKFAECGGRVLYL